MFVNCPFVRASSEIPNGVNLDYAPDYTEKKSVRSASYTITDSGRLYNDFDVVNFQQLYGDKFNIANLVNSQYKTLVLEITMEVYEIQDGYQYIFIYENEKSNSRLCGGRFEHFSGSKSPNIIEYTFYCELQLAAIKENDVYIRYNASGKGDDDWVTKNVRIQAAASFTDMQTSSVWCLKYINENCYSYQELPVAK